ncbi:unknown protein [Seminavis robusta]|uniref:Uncharacterized protein n=1 Tax=Seminavis robusta TaxID=568900 RepID=A0A9N8HD37_9STRA|nr:unknown protein [Seminavis robusta]|eukprot:Sro441_g143680.1 n/a (126) ;mRNA; r:36333-36710
MNVAVHFHLDSKYHLRSEEYLEMKPDVKTYFPPEHADQVSASSLKEQWQETDEMICSLLWATEYKKKTLKSKFQIPERTAVLMEALKELYPPLPDDIHQAGQKALDQYMDELNLDEGGGNVAKEV